MKNNFNKISITMIILFCISFTAGSLFYPSNFFDDLKSGDFKYILKKKKIREWNNENKNKISFDKSRLMCSGHKNDDLLNPVTKDCEFGSIIKNNSDKFISYVVVKIKFINKNNKVVFEDKESLEVSVVPTASKQVIAYFDNKKFRQISKQLKGSWSWKLEFIGAVPEDMTFGFKPSGDPDYNWL